MSSRRILYLIFYVTQTLTLQIRSCMRLMGDTNLLTRINVFSIVYDKNETCHMLINLLQFCLFTFQYLCYRENGCP